MIEYILFLIFFMLIFICIFCYKCFVLLEQIEVELEILGDFND